MFKTLEEHQKLVIINHDEVHVKRMLLYSGGSLFGKAANNPTELARSVLGFQVVSIMGGPDFLSKMVPVSKMNSKFLHEQITATKNAMELNGGKVTAIITNNNRTNQAFVRFQKSVLKDKP